MFFVAAHDGMTPRVLLEKLGVGVTYTSPLNLTESNYMA
jgi:hypothetical protein